MKWFSTYGDRLLAFITAACALMITQATALGLNAHLLAWITFSSGLATLAHTIFLPGAPGSGAASQKQGGRALTEMLGALTILIVAATMLACSSLGLNAPQGIDQQIANGDQIVKSAAQATDQAYLAHQISQSQAQQVDTLIHQVVPFLDQAKAAEQAGDTAGATKNFQLASAVLTALQTYVNSRSTP